jgi:hypothetical protein
MSKIKAFFKCAEELKSQFAHSDCLLTISVGQAAHEEEVFDVTMELVNRSFASCTLLIDDSLQRHNMALNSTKDADFFYDISIREGDLWLQRNKKYYNSLTIPKRIFRWDKWLKHPKLSQCIKQVRVAIKDDAAYKKVFDKSIEDFLKKYSKRLHDINNFDWQRARKLSYDFVTEECAALCLWPELQCHFEAYPIKHNEAITVTRERFIAPHYPQLLQAVNIGFRNIKQIKPQRFFYCSEEVFNAMRGQ